MYDMLYETSVCYAHLVVLEVQELRMKLSERSHDSQHKQSIIEQQSALIRTLKYEVHKCGFLRNKM